MKKEIIFTGLGGLLVVPFLVLFNLSYYYFPAAIGLQVTADCLVVIWSIIYLLIVWKHRPLSGIHAILQLILIATTILLTGYGIQEYFCRWMDIGNSSRYQPDLTQVVEAINQMCVDLRGETCLEVNVPNLINQLEWECSAGFRTLIYLAVATGLLLLMTLLTIGAGYLKPPEKIDPLESVRLTPVPRAIEV